MPHDWEAFKRAFVTDPAKPSIRAFAQAVKISPSTVQFNANKMDWLAEREAHWAKVAQKTSEHIVEYQTHDIVRETAQRLDKIRRI